MGIRFSPRHGVNPSIGVCYFCNEESGELILPGKLRGDAEAPRKAVWHKDPCPKCKGYMKQGIICISVKNGESGDNPYRTGCFVVLKDDAFNRLFKDAEPALKLRMCFIEDVAWDAVGLPRENIDEQDCKTSERP